jgi:hypothetical protein
MHFKNYEYHYKSHNVLVQMHESGQVHFGIDTIDLEDAKGCILRESPDTTIISSTELKKMLGYDRTIMKNGKEYDIRIEASRLSSQKHYGVIAQEIKDEFPELIHYDSTRMLYAVNYNGFVPVLLEAVKTQQQINEKEERINDDSIRIANLENRVARLEAQIDTIKAQCCSSKVEKKSHPTASVKVNETPQAKLYQNIPNPFTESTWIEYFLPASTSEARLYIYNMQGSQIENFNINTMGEGSITIQGGSMQPGMYMYTLIADDREVDTKRMILTK